MTKKETRLDKTANLRKRAEAALQDKNEEYEALNEELRSSVEELQAATEELQTQNEKLQQSDVALRESARNHGLAFHPWRSDQEPSPNATSL